MPIIVLNQSLNEPLTQGTSTKRAYKSPFWPDFIVGWTLGRSIAPHGGPHCHATQH